jgi:hypothetical protein
MKKTIIASAIAAVVAAPAAFAEVSISGNVGYEMYDNDAATGTNGAMFNDIIFKASEDLGNGMKASVQYHMFQDHEATDSAAADKLAAEGNTFVALSGDFGTIKGGSFETMNNAYFHGFADMDAAHYVNTEDTEGQIGRDTGAGFEYTSPSFNGLTVVVAMQQSDVQADGTTASTDDNDITDYTVKYSNGPLTVAIGQATYKDATADQKTTNIAASYTMGDLTAKIVNRDVENDDGVAADDNELTTLGLSYNMGANTFGVSMVDSDDAQDGDYTVSLKHNFSKTTSAYIVMKNDDDGDDTTLVGLAKKF